MRPDAATIRSNTRIEVIPLGSLSRQFPDLAPGSRLSVTCSPAHGVLATIDMVEQLRALGHDAIPHIAARLLATVGQLEEIIRRCDDVNVSEIFLVGGDAEQPGGPYKESVAVARDYLAKSSKIRTIGFTGYPDGHELIAPDVLNAALDAKQSLIQEVGIDGYVSTQMCFNAGTIVDWVDIVRQRGFTLPVRLGIPGHVERIKLARISARLGIGSSLKFLKKNKSSVVKLMSSSEFEPTELVDDVLGSSPVGVVGFHVFSFNNVGPTENWYSSYLTNLAAQRAS